MPRELGAVRVRGIRSGVREVLARHPRYRGAPDAPIIETRVARPSCPEALLRPEYSARRAIVPRTPRLRVRMDTVGSPLRTTHRDRSLTSPLSRHRASRKSGLGRDRTEEDRIMVRRARPRAPQLPRDAIPHGPRGNTSRATLVSIIR